MTWQEVLSTEWQLLQGTWYYHGTVWSGIVALAIILSLAILFAFTWLLRRFFIKHPVIDRAHRMLIYLLTMSGVALLLVAGVLGVLLPVIPGIPLLIAGFLLMRKYHPWPWLEARIAALKARLREEHRKFRKRREARRRDVRR
jgi:hypothetical protein